MAQEEGFEPPTKRLTAACSTTELLLNNWNLYTYSIFFPKARSSLIPLRKVSERNW